MATSFAPISISGVAYLNTHELGSLKSSSFGKIPKAAVRRKSTQVGNFRQLLVQAEFHDGSRSAGGDFVAGFLLGGAVLGTLGYIFAPQIRRSILNEDEYGFRRARRLVYYDEGLEKTRQTLNKKIGQLNTAIDTVSSRLRGSKNMPTVPLEVDPEVEATL